MIEKLKTDFKDEILAEDETARKYNLYDERDELLYSSVRMEKAYDTVQEGSNFNAAVVNSAFQTINQNFAQTPLVYYGTSEPSEEIKGQMRDGDIYIMYEV